jgi:hypothetical protein
LLENTWIEDDLANMGMLDDFASSFLRDSSCIYGDFTCKNGETCQPEGMATCMNHQEVGCLPSGNLT